MCSCICYIQIVQYSTSQTVTKIVTTVMHTVIKGNLELLSEIGHEHRRS